MSSQPISKRTAWIEAARPRTLPLALASIGMGTFLAAAHGHLVPLIAIFCALTTIGLQILSNFANDYGDNRHGLDNDERIGPQRVTQKGLVTPAEMRRAMLISALLSMISGVILVFISFTFQQIVLLIGFLVLGGAAVWAAIAYTATDNPYGYIGLGDIFVLIFFGWVGTLGTYYLQAKALPWDILLPATSVGLLAVAVLNINNMRDIEPDKASGKNSIPVRLGLANARRYHTALLMISLFSGIVYTVLNYDSVWQWLFLLSVPLYWRFGRAAVTLSSDKLDPLLKQTVLTTLVFTLTFGIGLLF